jgi:uncharacterized protein (DUF488 family)
MCSNKPIDVLTIGHSTHSWEHFIKLLRNASVTAVADVLTSPYSQHCPHFNRNELRKELQLDGISYVFLGKELGGRPSGSESYSEGVADYVRMAEAPAFRKGLNRVVEGAKKYRIALLCSERNPLDCHRCLLVGRALAERGISVSHILDDGRIFSQADIEDKLLELPGGTRRTCLPHARKGWQQHIWSGLERSLLSNHGLTQLGAQSRSNNRGQGKRFEYRIH